MSFLLLLLLQTVKKHEFCSDNTPGNCKKLQQFVLVIFIQFKSVNFEKKQRFLLFYFHSLHP